MTLHNKKVLVCKQRRHYNGGMQNEKRGALTDIVKFALIALLIVVPIRWFVAQPFIVKGASMEPTFQNGDYLIVDQLSYRFQEPERGDVIIMRYPKDPTVFFIKRVIGLPNETVELVGEHVIIRRDGDSPSLTLDQSFLDPARASEAYGTYALGPDEYFVMGDNRDASSDSRSWGPLPKKNVIGHALLRLLPVAHAALLPGTVSLDQ